MSDSGLFVASQNGEDEGVVEDFTFAEMVADSALPEGPMWGKAVQQRDARKAAEARAIAAETTEPAKKRTVDFAASAHEQRVALRAPLVEAREIPDMDWDSDGMVPLPGPVTPAELAAIVEARGGSQVPLDMPVTTTRSGLSRTAFAMSKKQLAETIAGMSLNAFETGGGVYVMESGAPVTPAMMTALSTMMNKRAFDTFKTGLRKTGGTDLRKLIIAPIPVRELEDLRKTPAFSPKAAYAAVLAAWGLKTTAPITVPRIEPVTIKLTSLWGDTGVYPIDTPYWFLANPDWRKLPVTDKKSRQVVPTYFPLLFARSAELSVLRIAQRFASQGLAAGRRGPLDLYLDYLDLATKYVYTNGGMNGLGGRLAATFALYERRMAADPINGGAFKGSYNDYKNMMLRVIPTPRNEAFMLMPSVFNNLEASTGVNIVTGTVMEPPMTPPLFKLAKDSEAGVLMRHEPKGDTFVGDVAAGKEILRFFATEKDADRLAEAVAVLGIVNAKPKAEVGTVVKSGLLDSGYGPKANPDAKWRFIYPVNAAVNYLLAEFLAPLFKSFTPKGPGQWHKQYYNGIDWNGKSLLGWSSYHRGLQELIDASVRRYEGFWVYSDNLYYYCTCDADGRPTYNDDEIAYVLFRSLDVKSMESAITKDDFRLFLWYVADVCWGVQFADANVGGVQTSQASFTVGEGGLDPWLANFIINWAWKIVIDPKVVFGNQQFTLPGEPSGHNATSYVNTAKDGSGVEKFVARRSNMLAAKYPGWLDPVKPSDDYEAETELAEDFVRIMLENGMVFSHESSSYIPVSQEALEASVGETITTDLLGQDVLVMRWPSGTIRLAPVLNRERRRRATLFLKSTPGPADAMKAITTEVKNSLVTLAKCASLYLMGGWSDEAEASVYQAMIFNARASIKELTGAVTLSEISSVINEFMAATMDEEHPGEVSVSELSVSLRGLTVPNAYDVLSLLYGEEVAATEFIAFSANLEEGSAGVPNAQQRVFVEMVRFAGYDRTIAALPKESWSDEVIADAIEVIESVRAGADLGGELAGGDLDPHVVEVMASVEGAQIVKSDQVVEGSETDPLVELFVAADRRVRPVQKPGAATGVARVRQVQAEARKRTGAVAIDRKVSKAKDKAAVPTADPLGVSDEVIGTSEKAWKRMPLPAKNQAVAQATRVLDDLIKSLGPDAQLMRTMYVVGGGSDERRLASGYHTFAQIVADFHAGTSGKPLNHNAYVKALGLKSLEIKPGSHQEAMKHNGLVRAAVRRLYDPG